MPRPQKSLQRLLFDGTFLARQHEERLAEPLVKWPQFAAIQLRWQTARTRAEKRFQALEFERLQNERHAEAQSRQAAAEVKPDLQEWLLKLGPRDSFKQLDRFFRVLKHPSGPKAGQHFHLHRFQSDFLREFWRRDRHGRRIYQVAVFGVPKGNGKTPLAAGLGVHALLSETDSPEVYGIAGSKEQAGIAHRFARYWAEEGMPLAPWLKEAAVIRCEDTRGFYKVQSSDGRLGHGVSPSAGLADELWLFEHERHRESYNALANALHKRAPRSWLLAPTTAGFDKASLLGEIYDRAINDPRLELRNNGFLQVLRDESAGFLFWWYGVPPDLAGDDLDVETPGLIRACNPASWIKVRDLVRGLHRADSDLNDWKRLHLNSWTRSKAAWLPAGTWAGLGADGLEPPPGAPIWVGVDVGLYHDSTAVVVAWRMEDGRIGLNAFVWSAEADALAHQHVAGAKMRVELVEDHIRELARRYQVREVAYDPRHFDRSADLLTDDGLTMVEFLQASAPMADAYQGFYQAAREGTIAHNRDPIFAAHVDGAAADKTERGWKVRKLKSTSRIDACVAAVMAHARAAIDTGDQSYVIRVGRDDDGNPIILRA